MMKDLFELPEVVYDVKARDGTYCTLPYPGHEKRWVKGKWVSGCPNFPGCIRNHGDFLQLGKGRKWKWYAVVEEFDLKAHAKAMKLKHPNWTDKQCRNLLYWQSSVRKRLRAKTIGYKIMLNRRSDRAPSAGFLLDIPEAHGVNVFATMAKVGVTIDRNPDIVRKVMLIGVEENGSRENKSYQYIWRHRKDYQEFRFNVMNMWVPD